MGSLSVASIHSIRQSTEYRASDIYPHTQHDPYNETCMVLCGYASGDYCASLWPSNLSKAAQVGPNPEAAFEPIHAGIRHTYISEQ